MATFERKQGNLSYKDSQQSFQTGYYEDLNNNIPTNLPKDYSTPYSYNEWVQAQDALEPNSQYEYYLKYVTEWYKNRYTQSEAKSIVKTNYINLLKQLNIVFKDEVNEKWFSDLNYDSDLDIQDMIEFYSKKLKQIAYFLSEKRDTLKRAKIKYNTVGSNFGAIKLFTDYILNTFTQRQYAYNSPINDVFKKYPALSGINTSFKLSIQELYDETSYFDHNPNIDITNYYNITSAESTALLTSIGLSASDAAWVYSLGRYDTVVTAPTTTTLSLSDYGNINDGTLVQDLLISLTEKYIGASLYNANVTNTEFSNITATYNILQGNNWFYWPSGEYVFENTDIQIKPIALSATTLLSPTFSDTTPNSATASTEYTTSDRIFVLDYQGIKGAWAQSVSSESTTQVMSALVMGNNHLLFKYPFPGYGEASDTLPWTGRSYENVTGVYRFLDTETKKIIESFYFSDTAVEANPVTPIKINETTLVQAGAKPGKQYKDADKITIRVATNPDKIHDITPNGVYTDDLQYLWLYDVTRTNLNADVGQTNIVWPLQTYKTTPDETYIIPDDYCTPTPLSALSHKQFVGSRAGTGLYDADIIYILDSVNGAAIQAAFLSAGPIKNVLSTIGAGNTRFTHEISGTHQPGLFLKCPPGQYTTFLWADSSVDINDTSITYHEIPKSSQFRKITHKSIYDSRLKTLPAVYSESEIPAEQTFTDFGIGPGIGDWKTDDSRSVLFSPIGHPGNTYDDYDKMCDIIFLDHSYPNPFVLNTWKDAQGRGYKTSTDFGWFKLDSNSKLQPDVGWGPGKWVNYNGTNSFMLSAGYQYKYLRANLRRNTGDLQLQAVPYLVIKQPYKIANTIWVPTQYTGTAFAPTTGYTDIVFEPGQIVTYDHYNTTSYCITVGDTRGVAARSEYNKLSSTNYVAWLDYNLVETGQTITALWPSVLFVASSSTGPCPLSAALTYSNITWEVSSSILSKRTNTLLPTQLFALQVSADDTPIVYAIKAIGNVISGTQLTGTIYTPLESFYIYVTAMPTSVRTTISGQLLYDTIQNFTIPVDICVPLSGWDVSTGEINTNSPHAKPLWVEATDENVTETLNKGVPISDRTFSFEYQYMLKYQPTISNFEFNTNTVLDYERTSTKSLVWAQPLTYTNNKQTYKWKKLNISTTKAPLSSYTCEQFNVQDVEQSNEESDIVLVPPDSTGVRRQYINYYAMNDFTWTQPLYLKKFAPTKTELTLLSAATPEFELLNLLNRHYPTVAAVPILDNLVTEDAIGVYTPSNLGLSVYLGKSHTTEICATSGYYTNILDPDIYESNFSYTKELNIAPVTRKNYNAIWMKTPATFIAKSGVIQNSKPYEKFNPYQNKYEINNKNTTGINYVTDIVDPWSGEQDSKWTRTIPSTTDFRGVNNVDLWLNTFVTPATSQIYNWGTDLFGNNYALLKPIHGIDPYTQTFVDGEIWIRTIDNELLKGDIALKTVLTDFYAASAVYNDIINHKIQRLAIIEDAVILTTQNGIGITTVIYDYQTKLISTSKNKFITYTYQYPNTLLSSILQIPEYRLILMPIAESNNFSIKLIEYNIAANSIRDGFSNSSKLAELTTYLINNQLNELTAPVITYNPNNKLFNVSLLARNKNNFTGDYLISIVFEFVENSYVIKKIDKLSP